MIDKDVEWLLRIGLEHWKLQIQVAAAALLGTVSAAIIPFVVKELVNSLGQATLWHVLTLIFFLLILETACQLGWWIAEHRAQVLERVAGVWIQERAFMKLLRLPEKFFAKLSSGELLSRLTSDVDIAGRVAASLVTALIIYTSSIVIAVVVLLMLSPQLTVIAVAFTLLSFLALKFFRGKLNEASLNERAAYDKFLHVVKEGVDYRKQLKLYGGLQLFLARFKRFARKLVEEEGKLAKWEAGSVRVESWLFRLSQLLVLGIGVILAGAGLLDLGSVIAFYVYMPWLQRPAERLVNAWTLTQRAKPVARRIREIMEYEEEKDSGSLEFPEKPRIEFRDVCFAVDGNEVLKGVSFTVNPGEWIALVGASGVGKTTIAELLLRLYEPTSGDILVNDRSIKEYKLDSLRRSVVYVPSKPIILAGTVAENIALSRSYDRKEVEKVARICKVDFVGLDETIGEGGKGLSEGQIQRIGLARALLRKPKVLILDEATSAIDSRTEQEILENIKKEYPSTTLIIISHRLSTITKANRILVLDKGRIACQGRHDQLLISCSAYLNLIKQQLVRD